MWRWRHLSLVSCRKEAGKPFSARKWCYWWPFPLLLLSPKIDLYFIISFFQFYAVPPTNIVRVFHIISTWENRSHLKEILGKPCGIRHKTLFRVSEGLLKNELSLSERRMFLLAVKPLLIISVQSVIWVINIYLRQSNTGIGIVPTKFVCVCLCKLTLNLPF